MACVSIQIFDFTPYDKNGETNKTTFGYTIFDSDNGLELVRYYNSIEEVLGALIKPTRIVATLEGDYLSRYVKNVKKEGGLSVCGEWVWVAFPPEEEED